MHLLEDGGKYLFHELVMAHLTDFLLGVGSDEVADPTLVVNNIVGLQALEGTHDRIWIYLHLYRQFPYGRDTAIGFVITTQYPVANPLGYLDKYGLIRIVVDLSSFSLSFR